MNSRDAEVEEDAELFIGPPPPAVAAEAASANEAERFEEVVCIREIILCLYCVFEDGHT